MMYMDDFGFLMGIGGIIFVIWYIIVMVQTFLAYGTAYRLTKLNGDNGVSLFGWMLLMSLASAIPGLGIFLWYRFRDAEQYQPKRERFYNDNDNNQQ